MEVLMVKSVDSCNEMITQGAVKLIAMYSSNISSKVKLNCGPWYEVEGVLKTTISLNG